MHRLPTLAIALLLVGITNASLFDIIRRNRRNYDSSCCNAIVNTCCPAGGAMQLMPVATGCCNGVINTCCHTAGDAAPVANVALSAIDEEERNDMWNAWNSPVKLGVFINPEANEGNPEPEIANKRMDTPLHPVGSGSGSGMEPYFNSDSAKRDQVPRPSTDDIKKGSDVKKSKLEGEKKDKSEEEESKEVKVDNEKKSELESKASEVSVQGEGEKEKRTTTVTCQGQKDWLQCPTYQLIKIKSAFWGRDDEKTCSRSHMEHGLKTNKLCAQDESNTMVKLQNACDGESACELVASPVYFDRTDCPEVYKFLRVDWECAHSESRIKETIK